MDEGIDSGGIERVDERADESAWLFDDVCIGGRGGTQFSRGTSHFFLPHRLQTDDLSLLLKGIKEALKNHNIFLTHDLTFSRQLENSLKRFIQKRHSQRTRTALSLQRGRKMNYSGTFPWERSRVIRALDRPCWSAVHHALRVSKSLIP